MERMERKSNAAIAPTGAASKYALMDDGPVLSSSQMAAERKADAAAKAKAEDYSEDEYYGDDGYYSEDEAAEPQTELLPEEDGIGLRVSTKHVPDSDVEAEAGPEVCGEGKPFPDLSIAGMFVLIFADSD